MLKRSRVVNQLCDLGPSAGRQLTWKCSIPVTFLTATAGVSIIQTRETRERGHNMDSVSSLIPSGVSTPSEETRHTFTNRNFVYFPFVLSHPGRQSQSISSYLLEISSSVIRCFLVLLFRSFDTLQEITLPGQGSVGLCSKVHVLLMRTH